MVSGCSWWILVIVGGSLWFFVVIGGFDCDLWFLLLLVITVGYLWFFVFLWSLAFFILAGCWWFLAVIDSYWRFLMVLDGSCFLFGSWLFLVDISGSW